MEDGVEVLSRCRDFLRDLKIQILDSPDPKKMEKSILKWGCLVPISVAKGMTSRELKAIRRKMKKRRETQAERIRLAMKVLDELLDEHGGSTKIKIDDIV